jgi:hypothetical protein
MIRLRNFPRRAALWFWAWADEVQRWRDGRASREGTRKALRRALAERSRLESWDGRRSGGVVVTFHRREAA